MCVCVYICEYRIARKWPYTITLHGLDITEILVKRHKLASYKPAIRLMLMHLPVLYIKMLSMHGSVEHCIEVLGCVWDDGDIIS